MKPKNKNLSKIAQKLGDIGLYAATVNHECCLVIERENNMMGFYKITNIGEDDVAKMVELNETIKNDEEHRKDIEG